MRKRNGRPQQEALAAGEGVPLPDAVPEDAL